MHPITRESVKKAEDSYNEYKELEDDNMSDDGEDSKPAISIGEQIQSVSNVVELITGNNKEQTSEKSSEQTSEKSPQQTSEQTSKNINIRTKKRSYFSR